MTVAEKQDFTAAIAILKAKRQRYRNKGQMHEAALVQSCIEAIKRAVK